MTTKQYTYSYSGADCKAYAWFDWTNVGNIDDLFKVWKQENISEQIQKEKKTFSQEEIGNEPIPPEEITLNQIDNLPNLYKYFDYREICDLFINFFNKEIEVNTNNREEDFKIGKYHLPEVEDYLIEIFKIPPEEASAVKNLLLEEIKIYPPYSAKQPVRPDVFETFNNWLTTNGISIRREIVDPYFNKVDEISFEGIIDFVIVEFIKSNKFKIEIDKLAESFSEEKPENSKFKDLKEFINKIKDPIYEYYSASLNESEISLNPTSIILHSSSNFLIFRFSSTGNLFFNRSLNFLKDKNCIKEVKTKEVFYNDSTEQNYTIERVLDNDIFNKYIEINENENYFTIMVNFNEIPQNLFIGNQNYLNVNSYSFSFNVMNLVKEVSIFDEVFIKDTDAFLTPFLSYYNSELENYKQEMIKYENYLIYGDPGEDIIETLPADFASEDLLYEKLDLLYVAMKYFDIKKFFEEKKEKGTIVNLDGWVIDTKVNLNKKYSYSGTYLNLINSNYYSRNSLNNDIETIIEKIDEINFPTSSIKESKIKNVSNLLSIAHSAYNLLRSGALGEDYFVQKGKLVEEIAYAVASRSVLKFFGFVLDPNKNFYSEEDLSEIINEIELFKKENNIEIVISLEKERISIKIVEKHKNYEEIKFLLKNIEYDRSYKNIIFEYDDIYSINNSEDQILEKIESLSFLKDKSVNIIEYYLMLIEELNTLNLNDYNKWIIEKDRYENAKVLYNLKKDDITIYYEEKITLGEPRLEVDESLKQWVMGTTHLKSLVTLSLSIHDAKAPVRRLGHVAPVGFTKAIRTIAGTMVFLIIEDHPLRELMARDPSNYQAPWYSADSLDRDSMVTRNFPKDTQENQFSGYYWSYDQDFVRTGRNELNKSYYYYDNNKIPAFLSSLISPFNLLLHYQTEVKSIESGKASMLIEGIEITGESIVTSVNDMVTEVVVQFVATDVYQFSGSGATEQDIIDSFKMRLSSKESPIISTRKKE